MFFSSRSTGGDQIDDYFPPYEEFIDHLSAELRGNIESNPTPPLILRYVLAELAANTIFAEDYYLRSYPDVAAAVVKGELKSARDHYVNWGYFEGRPASEPAFDQSWYLRQYPDIAEAFRRGEVRDLRAHFSEYGSREGRLGTAKQFERWQDWQRVFAESYAASSGAPERTQ